MSMMLFINATPHRTPEQTIKTCGKLHTHTFMPLKKVSGHFNLKVKNFQNFTEGSITLKNHI